MTQINTIPAEEEPLLLRSGSKTTRKSLAGRTAAVSLVNSGVDRAQGPVKLRFSTQVLGCLAATAIASSGGFRGAAPTGNTHLSATNTYGPTLAPKAFPASTATPAPTVTPLAADNVNIQEAVLAWLWAMTSLNTWSHRVDSLVTLSRRTRSQAPCARRQCAASRRAVALPSPRTYICSAAPRAQARAGPLCAMISRERQTPLECCSSRSSPHRDAALYDRERISTSVHNNTPKQLEFQPPLLRHPFRSRRPQRHDDCGDVISRPAVVDRC